ncbi:MAG: hypothetical protein ACOX4V_05380 [Anaerovoracaceae bacterium]|jgi:hypothetical protein|nr:hypothetical protein [Clostridiales bacterium]
MNPALILLAILFMSQNSHGKPGFPLLPPTMKLGLPANKNPVYFDTFHMELLLDRLHNLTDTLEKINHLNNLRSVPINKNNYIDRIQESLDAVRGLLYSKKSTKQIDTLSKSLSTVKKFGDMKGLMANMEPILSMLSNQDDEQSNE